MEKKKSFCNSCGRQILEKGSTIFFCPNCGETEIARCRNCRDQSVKYRCEKCGFVGP